ncbi:DUF6305 family protein [candidate division KSB1 bacterium]
MKGKVRIVTGAFVSCVILLLLVATVQAQGGKAELPAMVTSCGQSPGPLKVKVFMQRLEFDHEYNLMATANDLKEKMNSGTPFKTLIIVTGASLKGMGAAGVDIKDELVRTELLIAEAKKQGITIIGAHVEGMDRRAQGAAPGDNSDELSIDAVCPESNLLLVRSDGDEDKRFTSIANEKNIPLFLFEKNNELPETLKTIFNK